MVKEIRGRSGAGSVPVHGLAPQNLSSDKHVDVCADGDEDRGSTPLASNSYSNSPSANSAILRRRFSPLFLYWDAIQKCAPSRRDGLCLIATNVLSDYWICKRI